MLRILTLNAGYLGDKHGPWPKRHELISGMIRGLQPHIVALQAVTQDQLEQIGASTGLQHHFSAAQEKDGNQQGNGLLTSFDPLSVQSISLDNIDPEGDPNQRILQHATFEFNGENFHVFNAHFSWVDSQARLNAKQSAAVFPANESFILAGDLNTPPESIVFEPFHRLQMVDAWSALRGSDNGFTFESNDPFTRIDYIWTSASIADLLTSVAVVEPAPGSKVRFSDHHGLVAELLLPV